LEEWARPAVAADAPRITELALLARDELVPTKGGELFYAREARAGDLDLLSTVNLDLDSSLVVVAGIDDVVLGYAAVRVEHLRDGTLLGVIDDVFVEPEARGIGLGEALMDLVVPWCTERGCRGIDAVALPGNRGTKNYFERFGLVARAILVHRPLPGR
jgi:GNAT superfamily N-acetyltransferase